MARPKGAKTKKPLLTAARRDFARRVFNGEKLVDAYAAAFGQPGAYQSASRLWKMPAVRAYHAEMVAAEQAAGVLTRVEKRRRLASIVRARIADLLDRDGNLNGRKVRSSSAVHSVRVDPETQKVVSVRLLDPLAAIREDNAMSGDNAPAKIETAIRLQDLVGVCQLQPDYLPS